MNAVAQSIKTVDQLLKELAEITNGTYAELARRLAIGKTELEKYAMFIEGQYSRICLKRTDDYELLLLCWEPQQETQIHGHDSQACWVHFVDGHFIENLYNYQPETKVMVQKDSRTAISGATSYMRDEMGYHSLMNASDERGMSLHLYVKPIDRCMVYDENECDFINTELAYDGIIEL